MTWQDYLRRARDELLKDGSSITPGDVVEQALRYPGAVDLFEMEAHDRARSAARRLASSLLRDTEQIGSDEETSQLFASAPYSPPRCLTLRDDEGEMRHKGIEHATPADGENYTAVLADNIASAQGRHREWRTFCEAIDSEWRAHGTIGAALRARCDRRAAA